MAFDNPPNPLWPWGLLSYPIGGNTWSGTPRRVVAGAEAFAADGLTPNARTDAQPFNDWLGTVQDWHQHGLDLRHVGNFGDASDGDVVLSINTVLTRTMYYGDLTIDSAAVVTTAGYPVFVRGVLTIDGAGSVLEWNGNAAVADVGGLALTSTVLLGGVAGGSGLAVTAGSASTNTAAAGAGGAGGAGTAAGAAGGVATLADADTRSLDVAMRSATVRQGVLTALTAGAGGGGGGVGAGVNGGGGGGGAGVMLLCARGIILRNGGAVTVIGGAGEPGQDGLGDQGGGGGGGGQGGLLYLLYREHDTSGGTISVAGGAPGAAGPGVPPGVIGSVGGAGQLIEIPG